MKGKKRRRGNPAVLKWTTGSEKSFIILDSETCQAHELFSSVLKVKVEWKVYSDNLGSLKCEEECWCKFKRVEIKNQAICEEQGQYAVYMLILIQQKTKRKMVSFIFFN